MSAGYLTLLQTPHTGGGALHSPVFQRLWHPAFHPAQNGPSQHLRLYSLGLLSCTHSPIDFKARAERMQGPPTRRLPGCEASTCRPTLMTGPSSYLSWRWGSWRGGDPLKMKTRLGYPRVKAGSQSAGEPRAGPPGFRNCLQSQDALSAEGSGTTQALRSPRKLGGRHRPL